MIYEHWFGTFNKKNELMSVDESPEIAAWNSTLLEVDEKRRTNRVAPVTIIAGSLLDLVMFILDEAKLRVDEKRIATIAANARMFKKEEEKEKTDAQET